MHLSSLILTATLFAIVSVPLAAASLPAGFVQASDLKAPGTVYLPEPDPRVQQ